MTDTVKMPGNYFIHQGVKVFDEAQLKQYASDCVAAALAQPVAQINEREELLLREMRYIATISQGQVHRVAMMTLEKVQGIGAKE